MKTTIRLILLLMGIIVWASCTKSIKKEGATMSSWQGLTINFDRKKYDESGLIVLQGTFATFVACGSQYAVWYQFPATIMYTLKDLDAGTRYQSVDMMLSISHSGNSVYDQYAQLPCDCIVQKDFIVVLDEISFVDLPVKKIENFQITASYLKYQSESIAIKNVSTHLLSF